MHELSLVADLFTIIEQQANQAGARKVTKVVVSVGELSGVVPELFSLGFSELQKGTIADKARLQLRMVKIKFKCRSCGHEITARNIMDESFLISARPAVQKRWSSSPGVTFTWKTGNRNLSHCQGVKNSRRHRGGGG